MADWHNEEDALFKGASMIKRLREAASPPGKKGLWCQHLDDDQLFEVYTRLKKGQPVHQICRSIVRERWGLFRDMNPVAMGQGLKLFRERVFGLLDQTKPHPGKPEKTKEFLRADVIARREVLAKSKLIKKEFDSLAHLAWLIQEETERYIIGKAKEQTIGQGIPLKQINAVADHLGQLVQSYIDIEIRLGLLDSVPSEYNVNLKLGFDKFLGEFSDGGRAMLKVTQHLLDSKSEDDVVTMLQTEDGEFEFAEAKPKKAANR